MYINQISALFWLSDVLPFPLIKSVRDFPWKAFVSRCFIFKPYVTHFNAATYSKAFTTVKRLTKRVEKFFK